MIRRVLVANRGEIAVRIIKACHALGLEAVSVYSRADEGALHVSMADDACCIGEAPAGASYLNIPAILLAARITNCDALHPGYGFLAENPELAEACRDHGLRFVGPAADDMRLMGDKARARAAARDAGVPVVEGADLQETKPEIALLKAREIGYPVLIKAAAGGGGRGMWRVGEESQLPAAIQRASLEAKAAFGNDTVYLEKYIENARHVEVQVLGDAFGNVIHLGERDCSVQRRHQKLVEESPSTVISPALREKLCAAAVRLACNCSYESAGTVEFIVDPGAQTFHFIEMNTRIQVEHPVTEMITGVDLVAWQIRIASGEKLELGQDEISFSGHSIECRINAERPERGFMPSPGVLAEFVRPTGEGTRCDTHCFAGYEVPPHYDSLLAKVIVHGEDRAAAIARMKVALREFRVTNVHTTIPLHLALMDNPDFLAGTYDTRWMEEAFLPVFSGEREGAAG